MLSHAKNTRCNFVRKCRMNRFFYSLLLYLALPFVPLKLLWRGIKQPAYRQHWGERLGFYNIKITKPIIWLHCVSVGETRAAETQPADGPHPRAVVCFERSKYQPRDQVDSWLRGSPDGLPPAGEYAARTVAASMKPTQFFTRQAAFE